MSRWFRAAIRLPEASPGAVTGAAQVVHFWAIPQQSAGSVNSYGNKTVTLLNRWCYYGKERKEKEKEKEKAGIFRNLYFDIKASTKRFQAQPENKVV